jgi:hypothetical protein
LQPNAAITPIRDIFGVTAVQVFLGEAFGRGQRDRARYRQLIAENERPVEAARVEPQRGVVDALLWDEPGDDILGIGPARHDPGADERRGLDVMQPGFRKRFDQLDLIRGADRAGFDLEAFTRALLVDLHLCRQIGHGLAPRSERNRIPEPHQACKF